MTPDEKKIYMREYNRRYRASDSGKEARHRYTTSERGRATMRRYQAAYVLSPEQRAQALAKGEAWRASPEGAARIRMTQRLRRQSTAAMLSWLKCAAHRRKKEFTLTKDDLEQLLAPMVCAVTGMPLQWSSDGTKCLQSPSIDRIDNAGGYVLGNVQCVALWVNLARSNTPLDEFQAILKAFKDN